MPHRLPEPHGSSDKLIEMGRISAPFGIKGWVKIQPFVADGAASLKNYPIWHVGHAVTGWQEAMVEATEVHGPHLVAKLSGVADRDAAALLKGRVVAVPRKAFPVAAEGEYYWADLVGLQVRDSEGRSFGTVSGMIETGANDVMVTMLDEVERLIPFISSVIKRVDLAAGVIEVDWGLDY